MENNNNLSVPATPVNDFAAPSLVESLSNITNDFFCSIKDDGTQESKVKIYKAINNSDEQLSDHINKEILLKDVVAHPVTLTNEETGEIVTCLRTVLVSADGKGYQAVSQGVVSSLQKIFTIFGMPDTWEKPLKVVPRLVKTSNKTNSVLTLDVIM